MGSEIVFVFQPLDLSAFRAPVRNLPFVRHGDFYPGSRELFTATVNQKVTYGLATIHPELHRLGRVAAGNVHWPVSMLTGQSVPSLTMGS
jgi:hypothetical protein